MDAVGVPAAGGQGGDIGKDVVDGPVGFPELEFPDAGRVDEQRPAGQKEEFAPGGRVPSLGVVFPDGGRGQDVRSRPAC